MEINSYNIKTIDQRSYIGLKLLLVLSNTLFLLLLIAMLVHVTVEYETDINTLKAFLLGLIYVPFLMLTAIVHIIIHRKLKSVFCDKIKVLTGKQKIYKGIIKSFVIILMVFITLSVMLPYAALPIFLNRHVDYRGYSTEKFPLQDIYHAEDFQLEEKQMYLKTKDGLKVWASEIYTDHPKAVFIYVCSIVQPSITYFYGHAKLMKENGYSSILLEVRGHGKSDGNRICLGYEEVNDVKAAVDYIKQQEKYKDIPIVVQGVSMGGAVAVNAFGQIKDIDALIAMSAYSSFEDVVIDEMKGFGIPGFIRSIELPLIRSSLKMTYGSYKVNNIKPVEQIRNADGRPVLLMASQKDTEVPFINMYRLKEADPEAEVWLRNSWEHFIIKNCDFKNVAEDKEYCSKILEFIENNVLRK